MELQVPSLDRPTRVGLAEAHRAMREALSGLIRRGLGIEVDEVASLPRAVGLLSGGGVQLLLFDHVLASNRLAASIQELRAADPSAAIVVLGMAPTEQLEHLAVDAGARCFLRKDLPPADLLAAITDQLGGTSPDRLA